MNPDLNLLQDYPFARLKKLFSELSSELNSEPNSGQNKSAINLSIGEPKHASPQFVLDALVEHAHGYAVYPKTNGIIELRESIAQWLNKRFKLSSAIDSESQVLPVNGTREALFSFAQCCVDRTKENPLVLSPNPFYQIYEGAAFLAGATPYFVACDASNDYIADFENLEPHILDDCQLMYICTPGNPSGAVMNIEQLKKLIQLAHKHDFILASDECYSEIYFSQAPAGLLQACSELGIDDYKNCVVFHSLSKRSNLPGLRSGFVAGDAQVLKSFLQYRTYHGCAMSEAVQQASVKAWADEDHATHNRELYRQKFAEVCPILAEVANFQQASASFYIWLPTKIDDREFAAKLYSEENITVLPGSFLSRQVDGINPGSKHVRIALVAEIEQCVEAAQRIKNFIQRHQLETRS